MQQESIQGFRLSPQQERLWLLQQADPDAYRADCAILIEGDLKAGTLINALEHIVSRHEILRTVYHKLAEMTAPVQVITDSLTVSFEEHDLIGWEARKQEAAIKTIIQKERRQAFDFENGPLLRASLIRLAPEKHVLVISVAALCADSRTLRNLASEISDNYAACLRDEESMDQPMQYADFAQWQNELLESEEAEVGREFWRKQDVSGLLVSKLPFEKRPFDKQPIDKQAFKPESVAATINPASVEKIRELAESRNLSVPAVLLACWQILVWRLTAQSNIVVAAAYDGRKYAELETAMGLFAKYLPLSSIVEGSLRFGEFLDQTNEKIRSAHKWQEYFTFSDVAESAGHINETLFNETPFFPTCFEFEERAAIYSSAGVSFSIYNQYACADRFKIKLSCVHRGDSVSTELHYDRGLFSEEDIKRLLEQFYTLLESALNDPTAAISELELLSDIERHRLVVEFNDTNKSYSRDKCIHELFEAQAERTPDAAAVVYEDRQLTYRELNRRANQLAHRLREMGVGPETLVALCVERSPEMIVGLLGILKAGGAYVPLDPALPEERLACLVEDTQARVILTQHSLAETLTGIAAEVICLDTDMDILSRQSYENVVSRATVENLVYVIFTSGSTGRPKGVAVEHRQLANYVNAILDRLDLATGSGFAMISTFAADLGNTVLFPSLCSGGCLHLVSQERATTPDALADYFSRHEIDCLKIVPSHLTALFSSSHPEQILPRRRLVLGGESSSPLLIKQVQELAPDCLIVNHYGPTETTVGVLTHRMDEPPAHNSSASMPLGRPIANASVYILDEHLRPAAAGVTGELYVGGEAVARGYLNAPEMTASKFIPDAYGREAGARLYRTGDLARFRGDGEIDFLGRVDNQVKVRGYRIELGEIEAALKQHESVKESIVIAKEDESGGRRIVAYIVEAEGQAASADEMRGYLKRTLPDYMVPQAFVKMKQMPLTANGKVDRRALPEVEAIRTGLDNSFTAPRTAAEEVLARIWGQVLGLERVGVYDNFFELGGDSIISIQIVARANQAGLHFTPRQLFQHQTVAELAAVASSTGAIEIEQGTVSGSAPLTPVERRFFEQDQPDPHHYNQSMMLEVRQALDPALLKQVVQRLIAHHDALRLRFVQEQSGWRQFIAEVEQNTVFSHLDLSSLPEAEQRACMEAAASEMQASLNLSEGPLLRIALFEPGRDKTARLLLVIHHLAVDGVSWRILLEDLQAAYRQLSGREAIDLPPKTTSFKQWTERLVEHAQAEDLDRESAYWLDEARASVSRLPVDYAGRINDEMSARSVAITLNAEETRALLQEVPRAYNTQINDVLLTALAQAFRKWAGQPRLLVDVEGHGREEILKDADLSRTVGWFTAVFPVLLMLPEANDPGEALRSIKEQVRAIPNKGIGYGLLRYLRRDVETAERLGMLAEAEVSFNYLGQFDLVLQESSQFKPAKESCGPVHSLRRARRYLITINGGIKEGQLQLSWTYSENIHSRATIEHLAQSFLESLRSLIAHCRLSAKAGFTPSDFPKAKLSQNDLNKVLAKIGRSGVRDLK
jgi:amino acid adenylation domain-containing protein/non-ribosomal peptide synthase protein (TIGR01720 family)